MRTGFKARRRRDNCEHELAITVSAAGVERTACGDCGHVSFSFVEADRRAAERRDFARQADQRPLEEAQNN